MILFLRNVVLKSMATGFKKQRNTTVDLKNRKPELGRAAILSKVLHLFYSLIVNMLVKKLNKYGNFTACMLC